MTNLSIELSSNQIGAVKSFLESTFSVVTFVKNNPDVGSIFRVEVEDEEFSVIATYTVEHQLIMHIIVEGKLIKFNSTYALSKLESDLYGIEIEEKKEKIAMNNFEMVNELDCFYFDKTFRIGVGYGNQLFHVHANCEQDALDILVDYFEEKEYYGLYFDSREIFDCDLTEEELDDMIVSNFIVAGNHCHYIESDKLFIQEVR